MSTLALTECQQKIIDHAAADIAPERLDDFHKYIADVLRPRREIWDSDVGHAAAAALVKYAPKEALLKAAPWRCEGA